MLVIKSYQFWRDLAMLIGVNLGYK